MKKFIAAFIVVFVGAILMYCSTDTDLDPLDSFAGDYISFVGFENLTTGGIFSSQVVVKIRDSAGTFYVVSTVPNYPINSSGFGTGVEETRDSTLIFSEKDTAGIRTLLGVTYRDIIRTEEVIVTESELEWSALTNVIYTDTTGATREESSIGIGILKKVN